MALAPLSAEGRSRPSYRPDDIEKQCPHRSKVATKWPRRAVGALSRSRSWLPHAVARMGYINKMNNISSNTGKTRTAQHLNNNCTTTEQQLNNN